MKVARRRLLKVVPRAVQREYEVAVKVARGRLLNVVTGAVQRESTR